MRRLCTSIDEYARLAVDGKADSTLSVLSTSDTDPDFGNGSDRIVRYVFSTPAVGRDLHTVAASAWQLDNFRRNPVFLWAHDDSLPPIARVVEIGDFNGALKGAVQYAEAELNPFADLIYRLVKSRYLHAVSTSWQPLEWSLSKDRSRPGGVDFTKVDLLEISQVPIPALPSALAEARKLGTDLKPIIEWAERTLDIGGLAALPREELEQLRRAAMSAAKGKKKDDFKTTLRTRNAAVLAQAPKPPAFKRGLYECAQLAYLLEQVGYCCGYSEMEADIEGDASEVPAMLGEALVKLGEALLAMTQEEVAELLAQHTEDEADAGEESERSLPRAERSFVRAAKNFVTRAMRRAIAFLRAGRALSAANSKTLEQASGHHDRALKHHRALGEHHEAISGHLEDARDAHGKAVDAHADVGEALQSAKDEPENAQKHITRAMKAHKAVAGHHEDIAQANADADDRCQDAGDSAEAMGRCVRSAQRCVRSVVEKGTQSSEPDNESDDDLADDEKAKESRAIEARRRRAKVIALSAQ